MDRMDFLSDETVVILSDEEEELTPEEKRKLRLVRCGKFLGRRIDPLTGNLVAFPSFCGLWRDNDCTHCFQRRLGWLKGRVLHAIVKSKKEEKDGLRVVLAGGNEIRDITSSLNKNDYLRLPLGGGTAILFVQGSASNAGAEITYEDAVKMNWPEYINTPKGQRISGKLGKNSDSGEDGSGKGGKKDAYEGPVLSPKDLSSKEELASWGEALKKTSDLDPHTVEELEEALWERVKVYTRAFRKAGGSLRGKGIGTQKGYVDLARIDWKRAYAVNMEEARLELERDEGIPF